MSDKDIIKGVAIDANAHAKFMEKEQKGLEKVGVMLSEFKENLDDKGRLLGIVLEDMSDEEAKTLYGLSQRSKSPVDLDYTEKRVLCACIYSLLNEDSSKNQKQFYSNIEKSIGVQERDKNFNFDNIDNVDSNEDRRVILNAIISFLFLRNEDFSFLGDEYSSWLFEQFTRKDIINCCKVVMSEYKVLGADLGIVNKYLVSNETECDIKENKDEVEPVKETEPEDQFFALDKLINDYYDHVNADRLGKRMAFDEKRLKKELSPKYSKVAYEAYILASKIENGFIIFTTYAIYLKRKSSVTSSYACIPYSCIKYDEIETAPGRKQGTRKLYLHYKYDMRYETVEIDDNALEEESLKDLLECIHKENLEGNIKFADTDKECKIKELDVNEKRLLLAAAIYILRCEDAPLSDIYLEACAWDLKDEWNAICAMVGNDEDLARYISIFVEQIPYPSLRSITNEAMHFILGMIYHANVLEGKDAQILTSKTEKRICLFDKNDIPDVEFNTLMAEASSVVKEKKLNDYLCAEDTIKEQDIMFGYEILRGLELSIDKIKNGVAYKAKTQVKTIIEQGKTRLRR